MLSPIQYVKSPNLFLIALLKKCSYFFSDELYLKMLYYLVMGEKLHLKHPQKFTEKIQWLKLYCRRNEFSMMVDKFEVKSYVASLIGNEYIIPTLGVWKSFDEIDFSLLPDKFIMKTTQGSHTSLVCQDKSKFDKEKARRLFVRYLKTNPYKYYREWAYKSVTPRIIIEQFIETGDEDLVDYKFFCFNGKPNYCQVIRNRSTVETIDFYDASWNHQDFIGLNPRAKHGSAILNPPINYSKMLEIASVLSRGIVFVRIDLYNISGKIYFGEITFYPAAGLGSFKPDGWNRKLGDMISLPSCKI